MSATGEWCTHGTGPFSGVPTLGGLMWVHAASSCRRPTRAWAAGAGGDAVDPAMSERARAERIHHVAAPADGGLW